MTERNRHAFATRAVHGGGGPDQATGAMSAPIYATSTYAQESPGVHKGYAYARSRNPTRDAVERCIADLENGSAGFAFASGSAATATLLECLRSWRRMSGRLHGIAWDLRPTVSELVRKQTPDPSYVDGPFWQALFFVLIDIGSSGSYVDGPFWQALFFVLIDIGSSGSYVRPVGAAHMSAGPDDVRRPWSRSLRRA